MKKIALILVLALLIALASGCSADKGLEDQLSTLTDRLTQLENRVAALEEENDLLMQENSGESNPSGSVAVASLMLHDWAWDGSLLTVSGSFARIMSLEAGTEISSCQIRLYRNEELVDHIPLTLLPGEADNSLELDVESLFFDLSHISQGDMVTMDLEILLSTGTFLTARGGSWEYQDGELMLIAG